MAIQTDRTTVDLSSYPDLVVVYLGMRVRSLRGLRTLAWFGPRISASVAEHPDGLLLHERIIYSLFPPHVGMRQYWRDLPSLERWTRALPHKDWWLKFLHDSGGTGFWHEAYFHRGGMEAIYLDMPSPIGFAAFAGTSPARGAMFSSRRRAGQQGASPQAPVTEEEFYGP